MDKIKIAFQILGQLTVLATLIAAVTPSPSDDAVVGKIRRFIEKIIAFLPTLGINPSTRLLKYKLENKK